MLKYTSALVNSEDEGKIISDSPKRIFLFANIPFCLSEAIILWIGAGGGVVEGEQVNSPNATCFDVGVS